MYQFINETYFDNHLLQLPVTNEVIVTIIREEIDRMQEDYLYTLLGEKMAQDFIYGIRNVNNDSYSADGKWLNLLFGKKNNANQQYYYNWFGFSNHKAIDNVGSTRRRSPFANYLYYHYVQSKLSTSTGVGESAPKFENAINVTSYDKLIRAWNDMVLLHLRMHEFIMNNIADYPDYIGIQYPPKQQPYVTNGMLVDRVIIDSSITTPNQNLMKKINLLSI